VIIVEKNLIRIEFNEEIKTQNGYVCGTHLIVKNNDKALIMPAMKKCDVQLVHNMLGHVCEATVRESAKFYGWTLKNKMKNCDSCAMAKSRQKNMPKATKMKSKMPGEWLFIDISHKCTFGSSQYWLLMVATNYCFSIFLKSKDHHSSTMIKLIKELKSKQSVIVHKIRCDNSGENVAFKSQVKEEVLGLIFEFTARQTPQQNCRVKCKYATLFS